ADNMLGAAFVHRQPRVFMLAHAAQHLVQAGVHRNRYDGVTRYHDFPGVVIRQFEQRLNGVFLEAMQMAFSAAGADYELQLFRGMPTAAVSTAQSDPMREI